MFKILLSLTGSNSVKVDKINVADRVRNVLSYEISS